MILLLKVRVLLLNKLSYSFCFLTTLTYIPPIVSSTSFIKTLKMVIINDEFPSLYINYKLGYIYCQEKLHYMRISIHNFALYTYLNLIN